MAKKNESEFQKWFEEQFGPPEFRTLAAIREASTQRAQYSLRADHLERRLARHQVYEDQKKAALYGWNAGRNSKPSMAKGLAKTKGNR